MNWFAESEPKTCLFLVTCGDGQGWGWGILLDVRDMLVQSYKEHCFLTVWADGVWSPVPQLQTQGCSFHDIFTGTYGARPSRKPQHWRRMGSLPSGGSQVGQRQLQGRLQWTCIQAGLMSWISNIPRLPGVQRWWPRASRCPGSRYTSGAPQVGENRTSSEGGKGGGRTQPASITPRKMEPTQA